MDQKEGLKSSDVPLPKMQEEGKGSKGSGNYWNWKIVFFLCVLLVAKELFEYQHNLDLQSAVTMPEVKKVIVPQATVDEKAKFKEAETILLDAMTENERDKYLSVLEKADMKAATRQEMIGNGELIRVVMDRLSDEKKKVVNRFLDSFKKDHGADMLNAADRE